MPLWRWAEMKTNLERYILLHIFKVDADKLIDIIKNEFELTIDIENLIKEIDEDGSGEIEYDEFKALLKTSYANDSG